MMMISRAAIVVLMLAICSFSMAARASLEEGRQLVREHCTRCHVVSDINPYGGIGSTPSFNAMKTLDDWYQRFEVFFILPPHPALVRIEGISEDRPENRPAFVKEIVLTPEQVDAILLYVKTLEKR